MLFKKETIINLHWSLQEFDDADYFELLEMSKAKQPEEREVDPAVLVNDKFAKKHERRLTASG